MAAMSTPSPPTLTTGMPIATGNNATTVACQCTVVQSESHGTHAPIVRLPVEVGDSADHRQGSC